MLHSIHKKFSKSLLNNVHEAELPKSFTIVPKFNIKLPARSDQNWALYRIYKQIVGKRFSKDALGSFEQLFMIQLSSSISHTIITFVHIDIKETRSPPTIFIIIYQIECISFLSYYANKSNII